MSDLTKKDFIYFQNEVLQDIKNVESKLSEKIASIFSCIQEISASTEKRINSINTVVKTLSDNNHVEAHEKIMSQIDRLKKKLDDTALNNSSKINIMQKDLSNACFKYDKIVLDNLKVNGLVGEGCPYKNLKLFLEFINKKIKELIVAKDKTHSESNIIKEKMNNIVEQFKVEIETEKVKIMDNISKKNLENDEKCLERKKNVEEIIKDMRMENYKYSNDLIEKTNELKIEWEKLDNIQKEIYDKFDVEKKQFKKYCDNLSHIFNSQKEEFDIIKSRFIEVRDLIKNVRFKKNLNEMVNINGNGSSNSNGEVTNNNKEIKTLTKKLNFFKKQKMSKKDMEIINKEENNLLLENQYIEGKSKSVYKENQNNDIKKYIIKSNIPNAKNQTNNNKEVEKKILDINKKSKTFINKNKGNYKKINDKISAKDDNNNNINYNINENKNSDIMNEDSDINHNENKNIDSKDNDDINMNNDTNYNKYENLYFEENYNEESNDADNNRFYEEDEDDDEGEEEEEENNNYNDEIIKKNENEKINSKSELINDEIEKKNDKVHMNDSNKNKYTKIKIKSITNYSKINNNKNNNKDNNNSNKEEDINIKSHEKSVNIVRKKINYNNDSIINKDSEINFPKTIYKVNKNAIMKLNNKNLLKSMSSKEIINVNNENKKEKLKESGEISEINFTNNNLKEKIIENKKIQYSSLSEDEKSFNNNYYFSYNNNDRKINQIAGSNTKSDFQINYNILPINFEDSSLKNDIKKNTNYKLIFRKIFQNLNLINFSFNEKFKNFSLDIYKNFDSISNEINKIYNEINKTNSKICNSMCKGKNLNFQINSFDLYNNSGIELNMNKKKKYKQENYFSFFNSNKLLQKEQNEDKSESPRIILSNVEPYLIKKFKKYEKNN